ncbi:hypothetical protein [Streptosporangium carneum]|uniref:Uncharacterized protein n=1 Tax=Streptosporangium carneum TaxID=47481 RepID=A0A9W6ICD5_9ACTN|nr:hypothetical protein [Streptosporangium carneum]GLK14885.1 hypothetical protein GCM10017600_82980 [Streptosporangium carneum]
MRIYRLAASAYLVITLGSIVLSLVIGTATPAWLATMWYPPGEIVGKSPLLPVLGGLLLLGLVNSWMLWQVLRGPAPMAVPTRGAATWLRLLLYADVMWLLIPSLLPDLVETVIGLALWVPALVLLTVVLTGSGRPFRLALLLIGLVEPAGSLAIGLMDASRPQLFMSPAYRATVMAAAVATFVMMVMLLLAQRRDGRWSRVTLLIGLGTFASAFLVELVDTLTRGSTIESIAEAMDVLYVVWLARTAHELNREPRQKAPLRVPAALAAVPAVLLLMVVGPEGRPYLTYTWQSDELMECWAASEPPRVADIPAHERDRAYMCSVSKPSDLRVSDQELLGRGRAACTRFAAGEPVRARPALLALLCPEVIGQRYPDLLLSSAQIGRRQAEKESVERKQREREARKEDAMCRDPWPALRTRFQATASYYDWDTLPYGIYDAEADTEEDSEAIWNAESTGVLAASGQLALIFTPSQDWATCVTAKALRSAPPPLRRKGWDEVVEADVVSESGHLVMQKLSASKVRFPNLARSGPGTYRLRLYTRPGVDLILVYPARRAA